MKKLLLCFVLLSALSCSDSSITENLQEFDQEKYFLNFDMEDDQFYKENQNSYSVTSFQNLKFEIIFTDVQKTHHQYYSIYEVLSDSIDIIGVVQFVANNDFGFEDRVIHFEIGIREAINNLEKIGEDTYLYLSNEILYQKLISENFGFEKYSGKRDKANVLISIPDSIPDQELGHQFTAFKYWLSFTQRRFGIYTDTL